jgi:diguanylate cyclase (GGDEF)-like protein
MMKRPRLPITRMLSKYPRWQLTAGSLVSVLVIGGVDYLITADLGLSIFYVLPIATLTWYMASWGGYLSSGLSAVLWFIAELSREPTDTHVGLILWNTLVRLAFFTVVVFLLTELKASYRQEQHLAKTDGLTWLLNRRAFTEILGQEIQRSRRYSFAFTLAYLDIDNFKQVNDRLGHAAGDRLLQEIARVLSGQLRSIDCPARLGGDEFAVLMPQTNQVQATPVLKRLFAKLVELKDDGLDIGFSIGAMTFDAVLPETDEEALTAADALMYAVKSQGKHQLRQATYPGPASPANPKPS